VKAENETAVCPRCGKTSHRLPQNKGHLVRDLPMGNTEVILKVNRRRFKCETCQTHFNGTLDFVGNKKNYTDRYAAKLVEQVIHSDVNNLAINNEVTAE
jgi:transposase